MGVELVTVLPNPLGIDSEKLFGLEKRFEDECHTYVRALAGLGCPELLDMLPPDPEDSILCECCLGSGWVASTETKRGETYCRPCQVTGWKSKVLV